MFLGINVFRKKFEEDGIAGKRNESQYQSPIGRVKYHSRDEVREGVVFFSVMLTQSIYFHMIFWNCVFLYLTDK